MNIKRTLVMCAVLFIASAAIPAYFMPPTTPQRGNLGC
jgi:hypothetical protein